MQGAPGPEDHRAELSLEGIGMTLIGVLLSIGVAVGFGLGGPAWLRILAGLATSVTLALTVRLLSRRAGILRRFARWLTEG